MQHKQEFNWVKGCLYILFSIHHQPTSPIESTCRPETKVERVGNSNQKVKKDREILTIQQTKPFLRFESQTAKGCKEAKARR